MIASPPPTPLRPAQLTRFRRLNLAALVLATLVIGLGAYVRLSDAGLGCPDWPGCYGHWLGVPDSAGELAHAATAYPQQPVDSGKAWKEMIHRYAAGSLGLLILALAMLAWRPAMRRRHSPLLPTLLLAVVALQGALGMWTVTLLLKPAIVTLHLLGGMTTLALLLALYLSRRPLADAAPRPVPAGRRALAAAALLAVLGQIALGGWVSSNYAALACPDLPTCQGRWLPDTDFAHAFTVHRALGQTAQGDLLPTTALTAIHLSHRLGALLVASLVGGLAIVLLRTDNRRQRRWGASLLALLAIQLGLGVGNVLLALPLAIAVAHTLGAAALLGSVLTINVGLARRAIPAPAGDSRSKATLAECYHPPIAL